MWTLTVFPLGAQCHICECFIHSPHVRNMCSGLNKSNKTMMRMTSCCMFFPCATVLKSLQASSYLILIKPLETGLIITLIYRHGNWNIEKLSASWEERLFRPFIFSVQLSDPAAALLQCGRVARQVLISCFAPGLLCTHLAPTQVSECKDSLRGNPGLRSQGIRQSSLPAQGSLSSHQS